MGKPEPIHRRQGSYLPHWTREGATYFITFRTADSLPRHAIEKLASEMRMLDRKTQWQNLTPEELLRQKQLKSETYQNLLDNCYGECVLKRDDCAKVVADRLQYKAEQDYRLWAWCVMPNHIHAVVQPFDGSTLAEILQAWKSVSSRMIGKLLGRSGVFWQSEYYDRLIRDEAEFQHYVSYTLKNPVNARLRNWKWFGKFES